MRVLRHKAHRISLLRASGNTIHIMRLLFGLKWARFKEWREVLEEEGRTMTWRSWLHMAGEAVAALIWPVNRSLYRHRIRTCMKCPLYDRGLRRCRPYTGSEAGCGCFVPYRAQTPSPCWWRERDPTKGWD